MENAPSDSSGAAVTPGDEQLKFALVQSRYPGSVSAAIDEAEHKIREAAAAGAQVICLQELFAGPYFCQVEDHERFSFAESIPGPLTDRFSAVAKELEVVLVLPIFEKVAAGVYYNSAAVIDADGSLLGVYRKMHIPDDPQFYEKFYFSPGDNGFRAWKTRWGKIGVLICWDQWFPEAARLTAMAGAEVIFYPTAIGGLFSERDQYLNEHRRSWETIQCSHALANGCYVAAANRVGEEVESGDQGIEFWGGSFVADPTGRIIAQASTQDPEVLVATLDRRLIETQRTNWPFFRDRRIDAYSDLYKRFGEPL